MSIACSFAELKHALGYSSDDPFGSLFIFVALAESGTLTFAGSSSSMPSAAMPYSPPWVVRPP